MTTATAPRDQRIYTTRDPEIEAVLEAAPSADLVPTDAPMSQRLRAWAIYGFRHWQAAQDEAAKIAAYREIAAEKGRNDLLEAHLQQAIDAGIF